MSDAIQHECGIAFLRLKKPLDFYLKKYGTAFFGLNKMYLLMEKQHNRGQDGAGLVNISWTWSQVRDILVDIEVLKINLFRTYLTYVNSRFKTLEETDPEKLKDAEWLKQNEAFTGEFFRAFTLWNIWKE